MAFVEDAQEVVYKQFKGSAQSVDPYDIDPAHGLYSQNIDFVVGPDGTVVQTRSTIGTAQIIQIPNADGNVPAMANWYYTSGTSQVARVLYYSQSLGIKTYRQDTNSFTGAAIVVTGAAFAIFAFNGVYAYIVFGSSNGHIAFGSTGGYIFNDQSGVTDTLFQPPTNAIGMVCVINPTFSAGVVTAGVHRIAFLLTSRTGQTVLCPMFTVSTGVLALAPFAGTAPDGVHQWTVQFQFPANSIPPAFRNQPIQLVATTAANNAKYYAVPGAIGTMPNASSGNVTLGFNTNDSDLAATGTDVTFFQNQLTQDLSSVPPFQPFSVFTYSSRMGYCTYDQSGFPVVYFSDQNAFQQLTAAYHGIYLEGRQIAVHGVSLGAICYLATLSGLYMTQDTGGYPATWTPPSRVDGSVGILAPTNMIASGGKIILASEKGLFFYRGGAFPQVPISYWQTPDWQRINWTAPSQVQVIDDALNRTIIVLAPLQVSVTNASNTNPITITTAIMIGGKSIAYPHLLQTGLSVTIAGVGGNTNANGTRTITVTGANTFTIAVAGNGAYTGGGTVTPNGPNAEMSWNYSDGETPGLLYYSLNAFSAYRTGSASVIRNIGNNLDEVWYMPGASNPGGLIRRVQANDTNPNREVDMSGNAAAISSLYELGLAPGYDPSASLHEFHGEHLRVYGNGNLALTAFGVDHIRSIVPAGSPIALSSSPGQEILIKWWMRNEQQSVQMGTNAIDAWWVIAMAKIYWTPSLPYR